MAGLAAKRYAEALFSACSETDSLDECFEQAKELLKILEGEDRFIAVLSHPGISISEKLGIIEKTFRSRTSDNLTGLMILMVRKKRADDILTALRSFIEYVRQERGIVTAYLSSAVPVGDERLRLIREKLDAMLGKRVEISARLDPGLIAGIKIEVDGRLFDGSVKRGIDEMRKKLLEVRL